MVFQKIKETPKYSLSILFGTIGGNLGLWLGWSILSVMEFLQWIGMTVVQFVMGRKKRTINMKESKKSSDVKTGTGEGQNSNRYLWDLKIKEVEFFDIKDFNYQNFLDFPILVEKKKLLKIYKSLQKKL